MVANLCWMLYSKQSQGWYWSLCPCPVQCGRGNPFTWFCPQWLGQVLSAAMYSRRPLVMSTQTWFLSDGLCQYLTAKQTLSGKNAFTFSFQSSFPLLHIKLIQLPWCPLALVYFHFWCLLVVWHRWGEGASQAHWGKKDSSGFLISMGFLFDPTGGAHLVLKWTPVPSAVKWTYVGCLLWPGCGWGTTWPGSCPSQVGRSYSALPLCYSSSPGVSNQLTFLFNLSEFPFSHLLSYL